MIGAYYKTITDCPLKVFIDIVITGDVKYLKRWGYVQRRALAVAWDDIFDDYLKESNEAQYVILLRRLKDVAMTKNKIRLTLYAVNNLELRYNKGLVELLNKLGYRHRFDPLKPEEYYQDLIRVHKDVKNLITTVEEMDEKLNGDKNNAVKETDFDSLLVELGRFQGYRLQKNSLTVSEYLQILKNYKQVNRPKNGKFGKN
jgi:hypothetical protein